MQALYDLFPDYARDLKLNLQNVLKQAELTEQQTWGTAVASVVAARNPQLIEAVLAEAGQHLSPEAMQAAKAAAAIMGMNNIYYRFQHLSGNDRYGQIPARLRMQVIRSHGSDPVDFELWCTAVSAINGCGACVASHENVLREKGVTEETILAAIRIASVIHGAAAVLDTLAVANSTPSPAPAH
ncbi:MAG TPA: carboxymuconolactone decarboxylase family protein [Bryobacteraceae bacterium]|nr:carboxymuconolactone decarboxylase family protein [Bryobacteraceae bacterium]